MERNTKGVLGTKLGMSQVFDDQGRIVPVTVVRAGPCVVTAVRTPERDGYAGVQLGYGEIDPRKVTKPVAGHFSAAGVTPRRYLAELRTSDASEYTLGQEVTAETFAPGQLVDVTGKSKGKGTAGVMKRHGFGGRARRTAPSASTGRPAPSAAARPRDGSSRGCAWLAGWATSASPCRA
jgi:large subunit ribosomal protein L3